jgi:hypothetical protein
VVKSCRKTTQRPRYLLEAKAAALHPERYQSSLSKLSTRGRVRRGKKRRQSDWLANQMDRKVMDRKVMDRKVMDRQVIDKQVEDRQTGRNKADKRWYPSRPCGIPNSGL